MDAIVSGSANVAVLIEGETLWLLKRTASGVERALQTINLGYVFGDAQDLTFLEDTDESRVLDELNVAHMAIKTLHLVLMLCDPETSSQAAQLGAAELELLLTRSKVAERVERILNAQPMPSAFDLGIAKTRCHTTQPTKAIAFFEKLDAQQSAIAEVRQAWDALPGSLFTNGEERAFIGGLLAREGLFRSLVLAHLADANMGQWLAQALTNPAVKRWQVKKWLLPTWVEGLGILSGRRPLNPAPTSTKLLENIVEQNLEKEVNWAVFEPNDKKLWKRVTRTITAFLLRNWASGALVGDTPEEAFYIKCDAETNTPETVDAGQLICEIGMCPVRPAEFVLFRFNQTQGGHWKRQETSKDGSNS